MYETILLDINEGIALLTLNLPETRNIITGQKTIEEVESVCSMVNGDSAIKVLIITGADPAFSSGGDAVAYSEAMYHGSCRGD